jgi:putative holliday junction resolvase
MGKRLLGVDFGHARIGLSVSDPLQIIASPLPSVQGSKNPETAARFVAEEIKRKQFDIELIVVGLPIHLNGTESERSVEVKAFAKHLADRTSLEVRLFDERLTTVQAERLLKEASMSRKRRVPVIDGVSSTLLLQSFLDRQGRTLS